MIRNYFKIALRNIRSGGWYSALNIGGLAVVLAVSLLLFWWVKDELTFDRFHADADRIYLVNTHFGKGEDEHTFTSTPGPVAVVAQQQIPEVEHVIRVGDFSSGTFRANGKTFTEKSNLAYADADLLTVLSGFQVIYGDRTKLFSEPNSVVLTEKLARKFFGTADVVGKSLTNIENKDVYTVSAVFADAPDNSSLKNNMYVNMDVRKNDSKIKEGRSIDENWDNYGFETYVKLIRGADPKEVAAKLTSIQASVLKKNSVSDFQLQPITDIHLHPVEGNEGVVQQIRILGMVAVLLLSIGCINYVNLTTARASRRSKEVGIRKVVGAASRQLALQLLIESLLTLFLALVLSIALIQGLLPFYSNITGKSGHFSLTDPQAWQVLAGILFFCFLMAGIYPAFLVAKFNPILALRGRASQAGGAVLRKSLVVIQFSLATILIIGTLVIGSQLRFIRERDPGFSRENVFSFNGRTFTPQLKQSLQGESSIKGISTSSDSPVNVMSGSATNDWDGKDKDRTIIMAQMNVDRDFIPNFGIKLISGTNFTGNKADSTHFILNETAINQTGIKNPIGKRFKFEGTEGTIIGVVKDFSITSIREPIWPLIMYSKPDWNYMVHVHTTRDLTPSALASTEKLWRQFSPDFPFEYTFLDADYNQLYTAEQQTGQLFNFFAGVAIVISCLGLLGLVSFTAEQRTKEIGIRKVLGATVFNITSLLSKDFMKLIIISILIASPIAWYVTDHWLQGFAIKVKVEWWVFGVAAVLAVFTALITIGFQSIKAALADPVKSLRSE
jgi:putative ABC transport system permease protein